MAAYLSLREGCLSQFCITESAMDQVAYLSLVDQLLNVELRFKLADSTVLKLERLDAGWLIRRRAQALGEGSEFPDEYRRLPMTADPRAMASLFHARQRRSKIIAKMIRQFPEGDEDGPYLFRDDGIERFEEYFRVLCEMPKDYPAFRSQVPGCFSKLELAMLMDAAPEGYVYKYDLPGLLVNFDAFVPWGSVSWFGKVKEYACSIGNEYDPGYCESIGIGKTSELQDTPAVEFPQEGLSP